MLKLKSQSYYINKLQNSLMNKYAKTGILSLLLLSFITNLSAQSKEFIIYKDFLVFNSKLFLRHFDYEPKGINNYGFAIAYNKQKNNLKFAQYEAKLLTRKSTEENNEFKRTEVQAIYRRGKYLKKKILNVLQARYGGSLNLQYLAEDIDSEQYVDFPTTNYSGGIGLSFFAGIEYKVSDKINIHLDTQFFSFNFSFLSSYRDDPALTERQKEQTGFDFDTFGERVLKIGIGYSF